MKVLLNILLLLTILLSVISCTSKSPIENQNFERGELKLSFDKVNMPDDVASVTATLSRDGFDNISGNLTILDSNVAEIILNQIPEGVWYLRVEAYGAQSNLLYEGETYVNIIPDQSIDVFLTLSPASSGTGSINLMVTWGTSSSQWQDYSSNPIIESQNTIYDPYGISNPSVIKIGDQFHMWFHSRANSGRCSIFHATSLDGKQWNYQTLTPVLNTGFSGTWDDLSVNAPVVIFDDSIYKMYYTGWRDSYGNWSIGLATSVDGENWEKFPDPVIEGGQNLVGNKVTASEVIIIDNIYYLYFTSRNILFDRELRVAKSNDGINWEILPNVLMTKTQTWEGESIFYPTIIKEGDLLKMVYMTATESFCEGFGIAYSYNGIDWVKDYNNPIFTEQQTVNNYLKVCYPNLVKDNNKLLLYYTGFDYSEISFINVAELITN